MPPTENDPATILLDAALSLEQRNHELRKHPLELIRDDQSIPTSTKQKKKRRKRDEIERNFKCPIYGCTKSYGSEGALKTHVKLKHTTEGYVANSGYSAEQMAMKKATELAWQSTPHARLLLELGAEPAAPTSIATGQLPIAALINTSEEPVEFSNFVPKSHLVR